MIELSFEISVSRDGVSGNGLSLGAEETREKRGEENMCIEYHSHSVE